MTIQASQGSPTKRLKTILRISIGVVLLLASVFYALAMARVPLIPGARKRAETTPSVAAPYPPPRLTALELDYQRWLSSVTWQLPQERRAEHWNIGGRQYGFSSIRYHAAFVGYAAAALGMRTPAYPGLTRRIIGDAITRLLEKRTWGYSAHYWKETDPSAHENIMYTGHLLHLLALHEAWTGDDRYRTQGFDFIWDAKTRAHHDTLSLAEGIARQMRSNPGGGVACEPGLIFFPCNNHPQAALLLLEKMGLGNWKEERQKWEQWALESYRARVGDGLFRLFYHQRARAFAPIGLPSGDGWSLLWYQPWAEREENARELWREARARLDLGALIPSAADAKSKDPADPSCCASLSAPLPISLSFLAAAARACGDPASAQAFEGWLDERTLRREHGMAHLAVEPEWEIAVTANRILALAQAEGSDLRRLMQEPPARETFRRPLIEAVHPESTAVCQAYLQGNRLMVEFSGVDRDLIVDLVNVAGVVTVEPLSRDDWSYEKGRLHLKNPGSTVVGIEVIPGSPTKAISDTRMGGFR